MGLTISFEAEIKEGRRRLEYYQRTAIPRAVVKTLNVVGASILTASIRGISKKTSLLTSIIRRNKYVFGKKAHKNRYAYTVTTRKKSPNISAFMSAAQKSRALVARTMGNTERKGKTFVRAKHMMKNQGFQSAFLVSVNTAKGRRLIVLKRQTLHRMPLKAVFGASLSKIFGKKSMKQALEFKSIQEWNKVFPRQIKFYVSKVR